MTRRTYDASIMKVLNLRCANGHGFEGWFASDEDYMDQNGRGLVECPLCADKVIKRTPSAPRLNLSGAREPAAASAAPAAQAPQPADLQAAFMKAVREMVERTEDVGTRFAEEARRIHYGESPERGIRGKASAEEREALRDEGIETFALPVPPGFEGPLQ
jgi:hypothetical protein